MFQLVLYGKPNAYKRKQLLFCKRLGTIGSDQY